MIFQRNASNFLLKKQGVFFFWGGVDWENVQNSRENSVWFAKICRYYLLSTRSGVLERIRSQALTDPFLIACSLPVSISKKLRMPRYAEMHLDNATDHEFPETNKGSRNAVQSIQTLNISIVFYVFSLNSDSILTTNVHAWPSTPVIVLSVSGESDQILTMNKLHFQGRNPQIQKFCHNSSEQQIKIDPSNSTPTNHWPPTTRVAIKRLVQETQLWSSRCLSSVEISDRNQTCCNQLLRFKTGRMRVDQRNQLKRMGTNNWLLWSLKNSKQKQLYTCTVLFSQWIVAS